MTQHIWVQSTSGLHCEGCGTVFTLTQLRAVCPSPAERDTARTTSTYIREQPYSRAQLSEHDERL